MKITEIIEAPVSGLKKSAMSIGSKAASAFGMKDVSSNLKGKTRLAKTANNLYNQFANYLGGQGKSIGQATGRDLKLFLDTKNVETNGIPNGPLNQNRLNSVLLQKSREAIAGRGAKTPAPRAEPTKMTSAYAKTKQSALQLNAKEKRRLANQLLKSINKGKTQTPKFTSARK